MIGDKTTTNIALGYEVRKYDELTEKEKQVVPDRLSKPIDDFAAAAKQTIKLLKENSATSKANLERTKDENKTKMSDDAFSEYLFGKKGSAHETTGYIPLLRKIGVTANDFLSDVRLVAAVSTLNLELAKPATATPTPSTPTTPVSPTPSSPTTPSVTPLAKTYTYKAEIDQTKLQVLLKATGSEPAEPIALVTVFTDSNAYQEVTGSSAARKVYIKKGKRDFAGEDETQYVQDDDGVFTRRYGFMHKGKDVIEALLDGGSGVVKGKLQAKLGVVKRPGSTDPLDADPEIFKVQDFERHRLQKRTVGSDLTTREMLHVHQELGSGDSARGICLTSISLSERQAQSSGWESKTKSTYANDGIPFKSSTTVLVLVDLAKVPTGRTMLYNLYRPDAQARAAKVKMKKGAQYFNSNQHMLDSVTKNRELFLRVLLRDYIANWTDVERILKPPVTTPTGTAVPIATSVGTS